MSSITPPSSSDPMSTSRVDGSASDAPPIDSNTLTRFTNALNINKERQMKNEITQSQALEDAQITYVLTADRLQSSQLPELQASYKSLTGVDPPDAYDFPRLRDVFEERTINTINEINER